MFPSGACLGGAPANVAFHLHANKVPTALITRVGNDEPGAAAIDALTALGMDMRGIQRDSDLPTGRVGIEVHDNEARYTLHPGAWQRIACDEAAQSLLTQCQVFCYGTLSQESETGLASFREALAQLPEQCLRVCDPNLRGSRIDAQLVHEHMLAADIVKINDAEATLMAATYKQDDLVAWLLTEMRVKLVALTHGGRGATLITREERVTHAGYAIATDAASEGRDNIGAGDSFTALLVRARLAECSLRASLMAANRYGAFVASRHGATPTAPLALHDELRELMAVP